MCLWGGIPRRTHGGEWDFCPLIGFHIHARLGGNRRVGHEYTFVRRKAYKNRGFGAFVRGVSLTGWWEMLGGGVFFEKKSDMRGV